MSELGFWARTIIVGFVALGIVVGAPCAFNAVFDETMRQVPTPTSSPVPTVATQQSWPAIDVVEECKQARERLSRLASDSQLLGQAEYAVDWYCNYQGGGEAESVPGNQAAPQTYDTDTPIADEWQQKMAEDEQQRRDAWEAQQAEWGAEQDAWDADMCQRYKGEGYC